MPAPAASRPQLSRRYVGPGDTVSVMLANTPPMLEAHYGVPMTGAVLHSLNTRLDAPILAFQLDHANTKVLITDREFAPVMKDALAHAKVKPLIIDYDDLEFPQDGRAPRHRSTTRRSSPRAIPTSSGACPTTSGRRSASTTRPARRAIPRASSTTTAARR